MAKVGSIHKNYRKIKIILTNGEEYNIYSTYPQDVLKLDVDRLTHPAWNKGGTFLNTRASEVAKFNQRYSGIDILKTTKA
jgi:large subunit ribosomal protein L31